MVKRVKDWIRKGIAVKIVTARVGNYHYNSDGSIYKIQDVIDAIEQWCLTHIGRKLIITNQKDLWMVELWDDRAIQMIKNTGERVDGGK